MDSLPWETDSIPGLDGMKSDGQTDQNKKQHKPANHITKI